MLLPERRARPPAESAAAGAAVQTGPQPLRGFQRRPDGWSGQAPIAPRGTLASLLLRIAGGAPLLRRPIS